MSISHRLRAGVLSAASVFLVAGCGGDSSPTYRVGGTVTGLPAGTTVTLQDNGGDDLAVSASGSFGFTTALGSGSAYAVTVKTQPAGGNCTVSGGSGTVAAADVTSVAVTCVATALNSSTTSSTAFAVLATNSARIAFLPGTNTVVPLTIDGSTAVHGAKAAALRTGRQGVPSVSLSFSPDSCTVDSSALVVSCISYHSTKLAFLDVSRFAASLNTADITATEFESGAPTDLTPFSGGSCVFCGIVALTGRGEIVVAAHDGYRVYRYPGSGAASPLVPAATYNVPITENFAADPTRQWIAAPEYFPHGGTRKLRLIDLAKNKVYAWTANTDTCAPGDDPVCTSDFQSEEVDSATFDLATGMLVLRSESGSSQLLLDLSQASFDDAALTFNAPHRHVEFANPYFAEMSGALASPTHSWLFSVAEFSPAYIGVDALPTAGGSGGAFPAYTHQRVFVDLNTPTSIAPCTGTLESGGDPHSEGYTTSLAGHEVGLFIDDARSCIVKVDLQALYEAPRDTTDPTKVDASYDLVAHGVLTYLKAD